MTTPANPRAYYRWNAGAQRYVDPSGRFVPLERVRFAVDTAIGARKQDMRALSLRLRTGTITLDQWRAGMGDAVKDVHLMSAAAARGGWAQLTARDYGKVGAAVKKQYAYLDRFAGEIYAGYDTSRDRFLARAESYSNAGRMLYHAFLADAAAAAGFDEEFNVLTATESCVGPGSCSAETARGWVPIGELIPIRQRVCGDFCKCFLRYRTRPK